MPVAAASLSQQEQQNQQQQRHEEVRRLLQQRVEMRQREADENERGCASLCGSRLQNPEGSSSGAQGEGAGSVGGVGGVGAAQCSVVVDASSGDGSGGHCVNVVVPWSMMASGDEVMVDVGIQEGGEDAAAAAGAAAAGEEGGQAVSLSPGSSEDGAGSMEAGEAMQPGTPVHDEGSEMASEEAEEGGSAPPVSLPGSAEVAAEDGMTWSS